MPDRLAEISNPSQDHAGARRRVFDSPTMNLYLWQDAGSGDIVRFQLCYDTDRDEHALLWRRDGGFRHERIDGGEDEPLYNRSPVSIPDGDIDLPYLIASFRQQSGDLEPAVAAFVAQRLAELQPPRL